MSVWAILAAAGSGERLAADRPKAFVRLGELPLLAESMRRLDDSGWVEGVVVAAPRGWEEPAVLLAEELGAGKVSTVVPGGATRSESVRLALAEVPPEATVVVVHDAARPILVEEVIVRVLTPLSEGWDGAVPVLPIVDTVKRVQGGAVAETVDRASLVTVQTPQAFLADRLRAAAGGEGSDCASLVEADGGRIAVVDGDPRLLKVTSRQDLDAVAAWL